MVGGGRAIAVDQFVAHKNEYVVDFFRVSRVKLRLHWNVGGEGVLLVRVAVVVQLDWAFEPHGISALTTHFLKHENNEEKLN